MNCERTPPRPIVVANTTVGAKGRVVIPASVREAAGLEEGVQMVAIVKGNEHVELLTRAAIDREVWAAAPKPPPTVEESRAFHRAWRDAENRAVEAKWRRHDELARMPADPERDAEAADRLLRTLGIE